MVSFFHHAGFLSRSRQIRHTVNLKRKRQIIIASRVGAVGLLGVALLSVVGYSFWGHADTISAYPTSCLGSWMNVANAQGKPDLLPDASSDSFNGVNSAVLLGGSGAGDKQIFCSGFSASDQKSSSTIALAQLSLSWTIAPKTQLNPELPPLGNTTGTLPIAASSSLPTSSDAGISSSSLFLSPPIPANQSSSTPNASFVPDTSTAPHASTTPAPAALLSPHKSLLSSMWKAAVVALFGIGARAQEETSVLSDQTTTQTIPSSSTPDAPIVQTPSSTILVTSASGTSPALVPDQTAFSSSSSAPTSSAPDLTSSVSADNGASSSEATTTNQENGSSSLFLTNSSTPSQVGTSSVIASSSISSSSPASSAVPAAPPLFEIRYSLDGSVWDVAAQVAPTGLRQSFPIPLNSSADVSHLQIAVVPVNASLLPDDQAVYLDGMTLAITYVQSEPKAVRPARLSFSSDQSVFSADEISDDAFRIQTSSAAPCVATPFSQIVIAGGQASFDITVPNQGYPFVTKLGNYPPTIDAVFTTPLMANAMPAPDSSSSAASSSAVSASSSENQTTSAVLSVTAAASPSQTSSASSGDAASLSLRPVLTDGKTTLVLTTTASTTPGSYTLVVLYGTKNADKNISTGLCQINLIVR